MMVSPTLCAVTCEWKGRKRRTNVSAAGAAREERRSGDRTALLLFYRAFGREKRPVCRVAKRRNSFASIVDEMSAALKGFAELCEQLSATTKKLEKRALISDYLKSVAVEDASRAALYLSGQPFAETDRR